MTARLVCGDVREVLPTLPAESVQCVVTSPPYWWLRDYGVDGQLGLEQTPAEYVAGMVAVFREVWRVLRPDGTLWLNLGDSYSAGGRGGHGAKQQSNTGSLGMGPFSVEGVKPKQLLGIPWRVAFALQDDGWYLRSDIIWHKPNPMPESVRDRPTKAHEYLFLLTKNARYFYDADAIAEPVAERREGRPHDRLRNVGGRTDGFTRGVGGKGFEVPDAGRNKRTVWTIPTQPFPDSHFATFPPALVEPCILAGSRVGDTVLDPFSGAGTVGVVALRHGRNYIGVELNSEYVEMSRRRIHGDAPLMNVVEVLR